MYSYTDAFQDSYFPVLRFPYAAVVRDKLFSEGGVMYNKFKERTKTLWLNLMVYDLYNDAYY